MFAGSLRGILNCAWASTALLGLVLWAVPVSAPAATKAAASVPVVAAGQESAASHKMVWPDDGLREAFVAYWTAYRGGKVDELYSWEAPHFRFLIEKARYRNYVNVVTRGGITRVEILQPIARSPYLWEVPMWIVRSSSDGAKVRVGLRDRWIRLDDRWYHVIKDPLAFPETDGSLNH